ncbi:MAG: transketolase family protein [Thermoguttaceae bacterium]|nr:transketolase family protein [Thermoguttaceae bacterium]
MQQITRVNCKIWSRLGQRGTFFGIALPEIAAQMENVWVSTADLATLSGLDRYQKAFPDRFLNVGIAEQNMIGMSAGLAKEGNVVFATTYATFIAMRSYEQIRHNLGYQRCNVKVVGSAAGLVMGMSGNTHYTFEDIAVMRAIPGITIISPADSVEAYKAAWAAANSSEPMYIRLTGGLNCAPVYTEDYDFQIGKIQTLKQGSDVAIFSTGTMVSQSLEAAKILDEKGVSTSVYNVHTIKPLDTQTIISACASHKKIVSVEEHNVIGGLGSAIAEVKSTLGNSPRQQFIGIQDTFFKPASYERLLQSCGLTAAQIAESIISDN